MTNSIVSMVINGLTRQMFVPQNNVCYGYKLAVNLWQSQQWLFLSSSHCCPNVCGDVGLDCSGGRRLFLSLNLWLGNRSTPKQTLSRSVLFLNPSALCL